MTLREEFVTILRKGREGKAAQQGDRTDFERSKAKTHLNDLVRSAEEEKKAGERTMWSAQEEEQLATAGGRTRRVPGVNIKRKTSEHRSRSKGKAIEKNHQIMPLQEPCNNICGRKKDRGKLARVSFRIHAVLGPLLTSSERERHSSIVLRPSGDVLVRVRPQQITEKACGRRDEERRQFELDTRREPVGRGEPVSGTSVGRMIRRICSML